MAAYNQLECIPEGLCRFVGFTLLYFFLLLGLCHIFSALRVVCIC